MVSRGQVLDPKRIVPKIQYDEALREINLMRAHMGWSRLAVIPKGERSSHANSPFNKCFKKKWNISRYSARCEDKKLEKKLISFWGEYEHGGARLPEAVTRALNTFDMYKILGS